MNKKIVIAFGGNALIKEGQKGTISEQYANAYEAIKYMDVLIKKGYKIAITHGNGPQVGAIIIRAESSLDKTYDIPLSVAVAQSQGEIGLIIAQTLKNELILNGIKREVAMILTHVICHKDDPSLKNPTKPIGPFYKTPYIFRKRGISFIKDSGRGYRRVVPSPTPLDILEKKTIKALVDKGVIVIAVGGGGIPVYITKKGKIENIDGVVDKDLASFVLAKCIKADQLINLTYVEKVALNFNKPNQKWLNHISLEEAKKYLEEGHFPPGSMGPKIKSAIQFLENGGKKVIITSIDKLPDAIEGKTGTHISRG
ncbi:MAG: carbamate kinase [Candidatus Aenigmarchaeota archaeon]|nr:carbamate kinase [Candidatus Aenigmarchaeota archaeon]